MLTLWQAVVRWPVRGGNRREAQLSLKSLGACSPGSCPDWESNQRSLGTWVEAQPLSRAGRAVNVCFKRLAVFFTLILACLGTKEFNGMPHRYHLFHIIMKLFSLKWFLKSNSQNINRTWKLALRIDHGRERTWKSILFLIKMHP